ncbi:tail completion or Neck1 protein [Pseudomonas phage ZC01]|uniref:Uncharacterized protein n=1 Tax=Pseudomonas phage ZC01 TaxID=1622114 RepID=A0A1L2C8T8_9CAUD|nr:tail completion or Neck1 protein [Pseudomonas phage ZC01]AMD43328.1 hypothetical protein ZC01_060 [Pseudomonas phage ZC01]
MPFRREVSSWTKKALDRVDKTRRASALELFRLIILSTPVDNGVLINNWRTQINRPNTDTRETQSATGADSLREAQSNLGKLEDTVFFTNNLPYAHRIEFDGWSRYKAPQGMVRKNVARWDEIVAAKAKEYMR